MSNDHPMIEMKMGFNEDVIMTDYPYEAKTRVIEMSISYDGEVFVTQSVNGFLEESENEWNEAIHEEITTFGWRHANLIICSFLALLEAYGQPHLLNDSDIQEDFSRMVQETKNLYAEKAFEQIRDGLKRE